MDIERARVAIRGALTFASGFLTSHQYNYRLEGIFLPVSLQLGQERVVIEAVVDTGASYCLFARSVGESLGIEIESGLLQIFASAGGRVETFGHSIQLTVLEIEVDALVFFFANGKYRKICLAGAAGWTVLNSVSTNINSLSISQAPNLVRARLIFPQPAPLSSPAGRHTTLAFK